jgi:predicted Zn-dependent protease
MLEQKNGEKHEAVNFMTDAIQYWPDEAQWHIMAAELLRATGNQSQAVAQYESAAELEPENQETKIFLGKAYLFNNQSEKAIETLVPVSKVDVNNYEVWETLAEAYYNQQDYANAWHSRTSQFRKWFFDQTQYSQRPNSPGNGEHKKSLELAQKAAQLDGENAAVQILLAKSWLANGDKIQALHALEKTVHSRNASLEVMVEHAKLIKEINGAANARPLFESLVQKYPENTELLNLLADAQLACGDKPAAESTAQKSLKLNDLQPKVQQFLGKLEFEGGHLDQAIHHYSQAIAQEPQQIEVYLDLSIAYQQHAHMKKRSYPGNSNAFSTKR